MTNIVEFKQEKRELSVMERINKQHILYLCIDCEQNPCLGTASYEQALRYARINYCTISEYPVNTYCEEN